MSFIDLRYRPGEDLVCEFYVDPALGVSVREAANSVASESSVGTWTEVKTDGTELQRMAAKVFEIAGNRVKVAYPPQLFEPGNMPQVLSSVAGNVFGMKSLDNLRLLDVDFPKALVKSFPGPKFGIDGIREITKVSGRPLVGTIIKPKLGLDYKRHAQVAYEAWVGGLDIVKDDENLTSQKFNPFEKRLRETFRMKEKAEQETGERKVYMINVSAETDEMVRRAKLAEDIGNEYAMVDVVTVGWAGLQSLRDEDLELVMHAHRAGHAAFTRNPRHGISMRVISKLVRMVGLDQLHVGTVVGKMFETREEVMNNVSALKGGMSGLKPVMPVASGGLHPGHVPELMKIFGNDVVLQFGGGCHGHPAGTEAGAKAIRQAVDAAASKTGLKDYAKEHRELKLALERWRA